jgi:hypothetical protein
MLSKLLPASDCPFSLATLPASYMSLIAAFITKSGALGAPQDASASVAMAARTANRRLLGSYLRFDDGSSG